MEQFGNKYNKRIFQAMCWHAGVKFSQEIFEEPNWYLHHTWTLEQEKRFKIWMRAFLWVSPKARRSVMKYPRKSMIKKTVDWFVFQYGWKYDDDSLKKLFKNGYPGIL
jgi:hypothetical protein